MCANKYKLRIHKSRAFSLCVYILHPPIIFNKTIDMCPKAILCVYMLDLHLYVTEQYIFIKFR